MVLILGLRVYYSHFGIYGLLCDKMTVWHIFKVKNCNNVLYYDTMASFSLAFSSGIGFANYSSEPASGMVHDQGRV